MRAQALNALVLLLGEPMPDDLPGGAPLDGQAMLTDIPAGLPSDLPTRRRPDIMEAEQNLRTANANIGAARAVFFPSISLTGSFGTLSPTLGGLFKAGSVAWSFAPAITLPIFEGGQNMANLDLANAQNNIQVAQYEKAIQTAFREVADGLAVRGTYDQQIAALLRDTVAQQRRFDLSMLRYRNGVDSYLGVLLAQQGAVCRAAEADHRRAHAALGESRESVSRARRRLDRAHRRHAARGGRVGLSRRGEAIGKNKTPGHGHRCLGFFALQRIETLIAVRTTSTWRASSPACRSES